MSARNIVIWIMFSSIALTMSMIAHFLVEMDQTMLIITCLEKIISILYVMVYSYFGVKSMANISQYQPITTVIIINILYIGYRCAVLIQAPLVTEYVTFWMTIQLIKYCTLNANIISKSYNFKNYYIKQPSCSDYIYRFITKQKKLYKTEQSLCIIQETLNHLTNTYIPSNSQFTQKTKTLIKYILFHLALTILSLYLKQKIKIKVGKFEPNRALVASNEELSSVMNDLLECLNDKFSDYNSNENIQCKHFSKNDIYSNYISRTSDKFIISMCFLCSLFYCVIGVITPVVAILLMIAVPVCYILALRFAMFDPENIVKRQFISLETKQQNNCCRSNKLKINIDLWCDIMKIVDLMIRYIPSCAIDKMLVLSYSKRRKYNRDHQVSLYQRVLLSNFEIFLPMYFAWHIIASAFNDHFSISRIIVNYLYGVTQFNLNAGSKDTDMDPRIKTLSNTYIIPFCKVYDEISNEYEMDV